MALNLLLLKIITSVQHVKKKVYFLNTGENVIGHIFRLNCHNLNENALLRQVLTSKINFHTCYIDLGNSSRPQTADPTSLLGVSCLS